MHTAAARFLTYYYALLSSALICPCKFVMKNSCIVKWYIRRIHIVLFLFVYSFVFTITSILPSFLFLFLLFWFISSSTPSTQVHASTFE
jgi:hypothetical protein